MLATLLVAAPPGAASRTVSQAYTVPSNGVLKLTGHGYGHGHGMSQYGARGAARQGLTHRQILAFYYPGTAVSSIGRTIRVLITADTDNDVRVVPASGLRVRKMGGSPSYLLPTPARTTTWRLRTVGGKTVLDYYNGSWHTYKPGGKALSGAHEFYRPGTRHPARRRHHPRLPRRAAAGRLEHDQRAAAGRLREGRRPARDADLLGDRGRARTGRRRTHVRRLRPGRAPHPQLPHLRHHLVPGVRRAGCRGLPRQRRRRRHRRTRC